LATKFDPRLVISAGFFLLAMGIFNVTTIHYGVTFRAMVGYRIFQVIGMPLIFIPISTLNYVGVPRHKFNQVSGISNFLRNLGGGIGVSMLNNFIAHQNQTHRIALTAHTNHANPFFERQLHGLTQNFIAMGSAPEEASHRALAQLSAQVNLQANVLSFASSFWVLGCIVLMLTPLPFFMRRPSAAEAKATAAAH
jgi:DHA2 family multidrug resistance protein